MVTLRLGLVKTYPVKGDLAGNHERLMSVLSQFSQHTPDVVVTPECFLDGYIATEDQVTADDLHRYAVDPGTSPYVAEVASWAATNNAWVLMGCSRAGADGVYNSVVLMDRRGSLVGTYDKVHCRGSDLKFVPGSELPVFDGDFGRFGVMICADRRWPETVRTLALRGAIIIFNPTYGTNNELNVQLMRTRSFESEVFIAFAHPGQALVTDPHGAIVVDRTSPKQAFVVCDVDLKVADRRRSSPKSFLVTRRSDVYVL